MEPVENDDTPPPASRPLLRQAVAFASDKPPPSIVTYAAEVPEDIPEADRFLPGQKVPVPGQDSGDKGDKHTKVKKRQEAYPGQTTKFRLNTSYDPKFIITTPHDKGEGAQYRNLNRSPPLSGYEDSIANAALLNSQNPDAIGFRKPRKPRGPNKPKQQHTLEAMVIDLTPATDPKNDKESAAKKQDRWLYLDPEPDASSSARGDKGQESTSSTGTYYRRDYEADRAAQRSESPGHSSSYYRTKQDRTERECDDIFDSFLPLKIYLTWYRTPNRKKGEGKRKGGEIETHDDYLDLRYSERLGGPSARGSHATVEGCHRGILGRCTRYCKH
jgi:hypothetical protein